MAIPVEKLTEAALSLPSDSRALLADRLVESLDLINDEFLRTLWVTEAVRRRDEIRSGAVQAIPAQHVLAEASALLKIFPDASDHALPPAARILAQ
jgi:Putative addiction module component